MGIPNPADTASVSDAELNRLTKIIVDAYLKRNPIGDQKKLEQLHASVFSALSECERNWQLRQNRSKKRIAPGDPEYAW